MLVTTIRMKPNTTRSYKDLVVWQKGIQLTKLVYGFTRSFPADERFGVIAQMHRAAVSVPSNIAEGQARHTTGEFIQFISHAEGSVAELDTQLIVCVELTYTRAEDADALFELISELRHMLNALRRKLAGH